MSLRGQVPSSVGEGLRRMLEQRAAHIERGERMIGWKLGFGAPAWLERFGLTGPLVGFLPEPRVRRTGAMVSCSGWVKPVAEPEIAVHLGQDVHDPGDVEEAVAGFGAAIELADVDPPPEDIGEILAGNIFHRAVILGDPLDRAGDGVAGMRARVAKNGAEVASTDELENLTGEVFSILAHTAELLGTVGERLGAGEVVILGSVVPPVSIVPGDEITFELGPLPAISVRV